MESWGCGIHSFVAFNMSVHQHTTMGKNQHCCSNPNMNFEYFVQYASPLKTLFTFSDTTLRASFRLKKVLQNEFQRPWHPQF